MAKKVVASNKKLARAWNDSFKGKGFTAIPGEEKKSARSLIREEIEARGEDAARALGKKLKMKASTVDAYIKVWPRVKARLHGRPIPNGGVKLKPKENAPESKSAPIEPWYRYSTRRKAEEQAKVIAKRAGLKPEVYLIEEEPHPPSHRKSLFAVVPNRGYIAKHGKAIYTPAARKAIEAMERKPKKRKKR